MNEATDTRIPAGRYNVPGITRVYTIAEVDEDGNVQVLFDHLDCESHTLDREADVWKDDDNGADVPRWVGRALVERLNANPSAWDSSDGMRYDR